MRIVSFRDAIIWPAFSRLGYDPLKDFMGDTADATVRYANAWVRKSWDAADWYELSRLEGRIPTNHMIPYDQPNYPPPNYSGGNTYLIDQVVRDPNNPNPATNVYISKANGNTGNALSNPTFWFNVPAWNPANTYFAGSNTTPSSSTSSLVVDPGSGIVYVAQTTIQSGMVISDSLLNKIAWLPNYAQQQPNPQFSAIGKVLKLYQVDPRVSGPGNFDIPFKLYDSGIFCGFVHGSIVWCKFMSRPAQFNSTPWSQLTTYGQYNVTNLISDVVYSAVVGECFASAQPGNLNHAIPTGPVSNSWWNYVPFPYVIAEPVWRGIYSDLLRDEGQNQKAQAEEQAALNELQAAIQRNIAPRYDQITDQQTGVPRYNAAISTGAT